MFVAVEELEPAVAAAVTDALSLFEQHNFTSAIPGLRALVAACDDSAEAHYLYAMALEHGTTRDLGECHRQFERALLLRPGWFDALYNYGRTLLNSSREAEAEIALRAALVQQPDHPGAHRFLALGLIEQARFEEALPYLDRAIVLLPDDECLREEHRRVRERVAASIRPRTIARYPRSAGDFADLGKLIDTHVLCELEGAARFLRPTSQVFTMGSCFASNIAVALRKLGLVARDVSQAEEINNTYANRYLAEWIRFGESDQTRGFARAFGDDYRRRFARLLEISDVFILSLGVAPCFFDRTTGAFVATHGTSLNTSFLIKDCDFRTTTVAENVANLTRIVEIVREINPAMTIVLTVSPVPLKATFERRSPIQADCVSKSTLRVAAHEFIGSAAGAGIIYWPSFEIVRWLAGHIGQTFGTDDGSPFHPDHGLIELIVAKFVSTFSERSLPDARAS